MKNRIAMIAALAATLAALAGPPAAAQEGSITPGTSQVTVPVIGATLGLLEPIAVTGRVHVVISTFATSNPGEFRLVVHANLDSMEGTGLISGARYIANGAISDDLGILNPNPLPPITGHYDLFGPTERATTLQDLRIRLLLGPDPHGHVTATEAVVLNDN